MPRKETSLDKLSRLPPVFDRISGRGTLMAGNSSLLTDGAASLWVASAAGLGKLPRDTPRARLVDWEIAYVDYRTEGLLMAPAFAIPRLLVRNGLAYADIISGRSTRLFRPRYFSTSRRWKAASFCAPGRVSM
jgi:acetyl-CoA C-acetyltransferase